MQILEFIGSLFKKHGILYQSEREAEVLVLIHLFVFQHLGHKGAVQKINAALIIQI